LRRLLMNLFKHKKLKNVLSAMTIAIVFAITATSAFDQTKPLSPFPFYFEPRTSYLTAVVFDFSFGSYGVA
jgi:hypothetical protein